MLGNNKFKHDVVYYILIKIIVVYDTKLRFYDTIPSQPQFRPQTITSRTGLAAATTSGCGMHQGPQHHHQALLLPPPSLLLLLCLLGVTLMTWCNNPNTRDLAFIDDEAIALSTAGPTGTPLP